MRRPDAYEATSAAVARDVLDTLMEGCQVIGFDWKYLYVNDTVAAQAQKPKSELLGRTMMECFPGIDSTGMFATLQRCMAERKHLRCENEFVFPDGTKRWFELRFIPVRQGTCILSLDIHEAKRTRAALAHTEEQLRHAQKMEAVGRLAGGVAHDFNNVLSVILSYASILLDDLPAKDQMRADVEEIHKAGQRAAMLTHQLLAFSRQQILQPRIVDLNTILTNMESMVRRLVGEDVALRIVPGKGLDKVKADPGHLEQVVMNLVVNARDAMPKGGNLTIETRNVDLDTQYAEEHLGVTPGPHVMLAVSDTGTGMDKATQERIFEPFFTTKEKGKGTGLGLSTVFGIVQQSAGSVWVYSEVGKGTTFKIYLPRTSEAEKEVKAAVPLATMRGTETVLLVEDEDPLRAVARGILKRNGYTVLEARNGAEAIEMCRTYQQPIHLLLTDVVMAAMSGPELAKRVHSLRPEMKVLYMSGYTKDAIVHHRVVAPGIALLQKPITPDSLLRGVREVLEDVA